MVINGTNATPFASENALRVAVWCWAWARTIPSGVWPITGIEEKQNRAEHLQHPQHSNGNSDMALGDRRSERTTAGSALGCARGRQSRLGLAVRCGDLTLQRKNMPFWTFFHVQPKYLNDAIFVNTEGFRPCLSKPSCRAPKWALMVRLMKNKRPKSRQKSLF